MASLLESKYRWSKLTKPQLGKYAEYFVKMEFLLHGFEVYTTEVDEIGIDFVIRKSSDKYYAVQVKSARPPKGNYILLPKHEFQLSETLLAAVLLFHEALPPEIYLIPSLAWKNPTELLRDRNYDGLKSKPEWGINLSEKNKGLLAEFNFEKIVRQL